MKQQSRAIAMQPGQRNAGIHQLRTRERASLQRGRLRAPGKVFHAGHAARLHTVERILLKAAKAHTNRRGIGAHTRLNKEKQRFTLILGRILPRAEIAALRIIQAIIVAARNQIAMTLEADDLLPDFILLLIRQFVGIQFVAKRAIHRNDRARPQRNAPARLVIRAGRNMCANGRNRIAEGRSVLNGQALHGVRIIRAPDLREIGHHARIKAAAAAGASFKEHIRESCGDTLKQRIQAQHIAMEHLALTLRRAGMAVNIGDIAVHIPLDVINGMIRQQARQALGQIVDHFQSGQIQHQLVAAHRRFAARQRKGPIRMRAIEIRVLIDHLRLNPNAKAHIHRMHAGNQIIERSAQLFLVHHPVTKARVVILHAAAEPAIVQHHHVHAKPRSLPGDGLNLVAVEIEIRRFPVVDQHGPRRKGILAAHHMMTNKVMIAARERTKAFMGEGENRLRRMEGLARS